MAYFKDSFQMVFLGTKPTTANPNQVTGFITTAGLSTSVLPTDTGVAATTYSVGSWGLFDTNWKSVTNASLGATRPILYLVAASPQLKDKIGPFHGGYIETTKSKGINPKLINRFVRLDPCTARNQTLHIGQTKYTKTLSPANAACCFTFVCGETYYMRFEIKNEPVYRFLNHSGIRILEYNTGCCPSGDPTALVDSTLPMISWAQQIVADPILQSFIQPIVYSEAGTAYGSPDNTLSLPSWDTYVSGGHVDGKCAGLRLQGAYVDTVFGNCSFQKTDYYGIVPVEIYASMVDFNGDPCTFTGICVVEECPILQGEGFGETVLRDLILSESYRQNNFANDQRIREIELGSDILSSVSRSTLYTRYLVQHNIPRNDNPNGISDRDQYTLQIITNGTVATFETIMATWLSNANSNISLETFSCGTCTPLTP